MPLIRLVVFNPELQFSHVKYYSIAIVYFCLLALQHIEKVRRCGRILVCMLLVVGLYRVNGLYARYFKKININKDKHTEAKNTSSWYHSEYRLSVKHVYRPTAWALARLTARTQQGGFGSVFKCRLLAVVGLPIKLD